MGRSIGYKIVKLRRMTFQEGALKRSVYEIAQLHNDDTGGICLVTEETTQPGTPASKQ